MSASTSIRDDKALLRQQMTARRDALGEDVRAAAARAVSERGIAFLAPAGGAAVSGYHTTASEMDCLALMDTLARAGHATALPVVEGRGRPLAFRRWAPGDELVRGVLNIPVPAADAAAIEPDILLVPLLAFDARGYRLGYGAGYYDTTIAALKARKPIVTVGLAYAAQQVEAVPHEDHDERLDWVVSEDGAMATGGQGDGSE